MYISQITNYIPDSVLLTLFARQLYTLGFA